MQLAPSYLWEGPGSGKNTWVNTICRVAKDRFTLIDPDLIQEQFPEYQEGIKQKDPAISNKIHSKSVAHRDKLFSATLQAQKNLIFVGTGAGLSHYKDKVIEPLLSQKYHITVMCVKTKKSFCHWKSCSSRDYCRNP